MLGNVPLHVAQLEVRDYDFIPDLSELTLQLGAWTSPEGQGFLHSTVSHTILQGHIPQCDGQICFWAPGSISAGAAFWVYSTTASNICTNMSKHLIWHRCISTLSQCLLPATTSCVKTFCLKAVLGALCMLADVKSRECNL